MPFCTLNLCRPEVRRVSRLATGVRMNITQQEAHAMTETADTKELYWLSPLLEDKDLQILSSVVQARFAALSHLGKVRKVNEDHYLVTKLDRGQETLLTNLPEGDVPPR